LIVKGKNWDCDWSINIYIVLAIPVMVK
jgi:hypothetical protein